MCAFVTSLVWLTGPEGLGVRGLPGLCQCPARCQQHCPGLVPAGRSLAACSWPLLLGKTTSCDRAKQEIILSAQIAAPRAGALLRNGWADTE